MPAVKTESIRNAALVGHAGSGKTTLADAILYKCGLATRLGSVAEKTSLSDYTDEEKEDGHSIYSSLFHIDRGGARINLIDAPGYPDLLGELLASLAAVETALVTVSAPQGIALVTRKAFDRAGQLGLARWILITKMDMEGVDFDARVEGIREVFGARCVPLLYPVGSGKGFAGVVNTFEVAAAPPANVAAKVAEYGTALKEAIVEVDESLMEKYLEGSITDQEFRDNFSKAIALGKLVPIVAVSGASQTGVEELLDAIIKYAPSPAAAGKVKGTDPAKRGEPVPMERDPDPAAPLAARVFKLYRDPFVGRISFVRIYSGALHAADSVFIPQTDESVKIANMSHPQGKDQAATTEAGAGDIVAIAKVEGLRIGDTLTAKHAAIALPDLDFPRPMVAYAIEPKTRADEGRLSDGLHKMTDEDRTFVAERDRQTKELVARGISALHLQTKLKALKKRFEVDVLTRTPKVPYLETITKKAKNRFRHKKQTGGAGQFAEVELAVEPLPRGGGFEYEWKVFGGAISHQFGPSIEKGIRTILDEGILAGYPLVDVKAQVTDGKEHPVDSKDIAFQIAGRECFREAALAASAELLEPIANIEITVPSANMGDVSGYLSGRRGRPVGVDSLGEYQVIQAQIPMAEVSNFGPDLQSMTGGEGSYALSLSHYEILPSHLKQKVIDAHKKEKEEKAKAK
ncbi:MAG: elongation factor G [Planctomycetes bacterium]|nr:elongation factor G [Planctomycetota bacterium]